MVKLIRKQTLHFLLHLRQPVATVGELLDAMHTALT